MTVIDNARYWQIAHELRPVRAERIRRAVRMARDDIQSLLAALHENPEDTGVRGPLADLMHEAGRLHEAAALMSSDPVRVWRTHGTHGLNPELRLNRIARGMTWSAATPAQVIHTIANVAGTQQRLHLSYGDADTGRDWLEEFDSHGRIGRSMGSRDHPPVPLLIRTSRSTGGGHIMDDHIVRIRTMPLGRHILYQHPTYHHGKIELVENNPPQEYPGGILTHRVLCDGEEQAAFRSERAASQYIRKMGLKLD